MPEPLERKLLKCYKIILCFGKQKGALHEINVKFVHNSNKTCQGKLVNDLLVCMGHYVDMFPEGSNVTMLIDFLIYLMLTGHAEPDSTGKIYKHN